MPHLRLYLPHWNNRPLLSICCMPALCWTLCALFFLLRLHGNPVGAVPSPLSRGGDRDPGWAGGTQERWGQGSTQDCIPLGGPGLSAPDMRCEGEHEGVVVAARVTEGCVPHSV